MEDAKYEEETIYSLVDYINLVNQLYDGLRVSAFYNEDRLFFRGQKSRNYDLLPSIARTTRKHQKPEHFIMQENKMVNEFIRRKPAEFEVLDDFNILAKMQHYGLPTRLLDITSNSLVALYFASEKVIEKSLETDGEVFFFKNSDTEIQPSYSIHVSLLSSYYKSPENNFTSLEDFYVDDNIEKKLKEEKAAILYEEMQSYILTTPKYYDQREARQSSGFIIFPNIVTETSVKPSIKDIKPEVLNKMGHRIIVDAKSKDSIRKELSRIGITKEYLFPDMEHLAHYIYECASDVDVGKRK